jgi:putative aminopeptidase FrvX
MSMDNTSRQFLMQILDNPSPSGYEQPVQNVIRTYVKEFADEVKTDVHGNVIAVRNPQAAFRVLLAGHCDQIGLIVQYIDDDGYIYFQAIGGWDATVLIGQRVTVWTSSGPLAGVIGRKPIHLLSEDERKSVPKLKDLWIDIGAASKAEATQKVRIGDPITIELAERELMNNRLVASGLDDKSGAWVVMEALKRVDSGETAGRCLCRGNRSRRAGAAWCPDKRVRDRSPCGHCRGCDFSLQIVRIWKKRRRAKSSSAGDLSFIAVRI